MFLTVTKNIPVKSRTPRLPGIKAKESMITERELSMVLAQNIVALQNYSLLCGEITGHVKGK